MFVSKVKIPLFRARAILNESILSSPLVNYHGRIDTVLKRGSVLEDMVANKDKRKNWHLNILSNTPKSRSFEKVHKPHRRRALLNALFIRNITDVLSTADIVPDLQNYAIEITGVSISPCCKLLNVFWQLPVNQYESCEDVGKLLTIAAPKIRGELISRNVLGRVPYIFFLRDSTNARVAAFEEAMKKLDAEPKSSDPCITVDDSFIEDMFLFKTGKDEVKQRQDTKTEKKNYITDDAEEENSDSVKDNTEKENVDAIKSNTEEENFDSIIYNIKKEPPSIPQKPADMKCDIFGLDHELMMGKVIALKKRKKEPLKKSAVISPDSVMSVQDDLFSKIPGVCFQADSSREIILKKFQIERKILMRKKKERLPNDNNVSYEDIEENDYNEPDSFGEDFVEDETTENSRY